MKRFMSVLLAMLMVASFVTSGILAGGTGNDWIADPTKAGQDGIEIKTAGSKDAELDFVAFKQATVWFIWARKGVEAITPAIVQSFKDADSGVKNATYTSEYNFSGLGYGNGNGHFNEGNLNAWYWVDFNNGEYRVCVENLKDGNGSEKISHIVVMWGPADPTTTTTVPETTTTTTTVPETTTTTTTVPETTTTTTTVPETTTTTTTVPETTTTTTTVPETTTTTTTVPETTTTTTTEIPTPTTTERTRTERTTTTTTTTVVEITETQPPLTNAPTTAVVTTTLPVDIDDAETPLAGLPNTGAQNSHEAAIFFGALGILLGAGSAVLAVAAKKEED